MATVTEPLTHVDADADEPGGRPRRDYDRSSLDGDYMVIIPGQTAEDFEKYAPEKQFCEYFHGVIYMPSPVSHEHQRHVGFLHLLLGSFCEERDGNDVLMGPAVLRLAPEEKPEPDLFVLPPAAAAAAPGAPKALLVVEVLSPSNRSHDLKRKAAYYQAAGIPEIWYLDDRDRVVVDRRTADGYSRERLKDGFLVSTGLPGFWIDVAWLWQDPKPKSRTCLDRIFAGPPAPEPRPTP